MIARHRYAHHLPDYDFVVSHHRFCRHCSDGENSALRRIDHGSELIDAKHAEIANRESRASVFLRFQLARSRSLSQLAHLAGYLA